jgi:hypothetical protein
VGQTAIGIIGAFRGTLPPRDPYSWRDWLQDLFAEPVPYRGLPGMVHSGFLEALNSILPQVITATNSLNPSPTNPVAYIPDIGPDLSKLISEAAGWNYTPVGAELFIESAANHYQINTSELALEQVLDFTWNLAQNIGDWETALGNAHALGCGYGYMSGTCPTSVCNG